jgi:ribonuclease VapC
MNSCILDASAILAYLEGESGSPDVEKVLDEAGVSAVNIAEVASKLAERGAPANRIRQTIQALGLSLGDRACLATALQHNVRAITADRHWKTLKVGARIQVIR